MLAIPTIKQIMVRQELPDPSKALTDVTFVTEPRLSTKSLQNFWFRLEIEKRIAGLTDDTMLWSPFTPAEQHISMSDSHFYIEQEISLESTRVFHARIPSLTAARRLFYPSGVAIAQGRRDVRRRPRVCL